MARHTDWTDRVYAALAEQEDARACRAISDEACREVPGNFLRIAASNTLTKVGDRVASPKTTIAWLLQALGAPPVVTGLIVPIRESGSLLPQLAIAAFVRGLPIRKWVWVFGAVVQALAIGAIGGFALVLRGAAAGWSIAGMLVLFSLARGFCSVASKDVLGKTIPKARRGRLNGLTASASGLLGLVAGLAMIFGHSDPAGGGSVTRFAALLLAAGALWLLAATIYARINEFPGETAGGRNGGIEALRKLDLLRRDRSFRNFVAVRSLAIGSGLSAPFVVTLAHRALGGAALWLGVFIVADGLAAMLSARAWGRRADRSSRGVLVASMALTGGLLVVVAGAGWLGLPPLAARVFFPLAFFLLGIAHSGVRLGRKTYLVDMAEGNLRTDYVAVSNTVIGVILLAAGAVTGSIALLSVPVALAVFAACALGGALLGRSLPEVSDEP
jgi:hypothetical protein